MVSDINGHLIRENEAIGRSFLDMAFIIFFFFKYIFFHRFNRSPLFSMEALF